jgi:hypothetical protein
LVEWFQGEIVEAPPWQRVAIERNTAKANHSITAADFN